MLLELRIENLLLIERARLEVGPGLNVITGETGAGKTMLAHAIDLLLGGKSRKGIVRPGASEAYVEGLFELPARMLDEKRFAEIRERLPEATELGETVELVLARRVTPDGRTRAYIEGRSATAADLRLLGCAMVAFYGQHEHRKLTVGGSQLAALDNFAALGGGKTAAAHRARLERAAELAARRRELDAGLTGLQELEGRRERELGLVEFELAEIEELGPDPAEETELVAERARLRAVDSLRSAAEAALLALDGDPEDGASSGAGAAPAVAAAAAQIDAVAGADEQLDELAQRVQALAVELSEAAHELRSYADGIAADPERLAQIEERLEAYDRLKRKHGGSVDAVIAHADHCRAERDRLTGAQTSLNELTAELETVRAEQRQVCEAISTARRKAAPKLAERVREGLSDLAMDGASFEVAIESDEQRPAASGWDTVEFMIAPNPGIAAAPLREIASGGELSRVMLALLTASGGAGGGTFVFDEVDAGIGGHTARAVGERLRSLGEQRQVLCITHLPQVAAAAARHFQIEKSSAGGEARTAVRRLDDDEVVEELCRMLGADAADAGARGHARELLAGRDLAAAGRELVAV